MLPAMLSRMLWRRLRRTMSPQADGLQAAGIERYSVFQGHLHIKGAFDAPAGVRHLALHMPGGEVLPLRFGPSGPGRVGFDQVIAVPGSPPEVAAATLVAGLEGGGELRLHGLGEAVGDPGHALAVEFQSMLHARPPGRMLEVGSRARSGIMRRDWAPPGWAYSGFDILPGPNVDVIGDAHVISRHYEPGRFDAVMAFSVLEHLLMPWKFVVELNRVLKLGGIGMFSTHQCWPIHDQPWDFWRFSDTAWIGLLNPATGFEIIAARTGEPAYVVAQRCSAATAFPEHPTGALISTVLFRKIGETALDWPVELGDILRTQYPGGESEAAL
ncbi:MAG: methyltransferase domain-containing protein [Acetobacteraceae bacterium]|nr:methyltransferase domain-containing protein [Acetobacteraceae bacterium]